MTKRFVIEGTWSGYTSAQRKVVHRTVHQPGYQKLRAWVEKNSAITFTDGTQLMLKVRDCEPRERVQEIRGYVSLIWDCHFYDTTSVNSLKDAQAAARRRNVLTT